MNNPKTSTRRVAKLMVGIAACAVALAGFSAAASADPGNGAGGVTGPAFYVDGELYRTVGTPMVDVSPPWLVLAQTRRLGNSDMRKVTQGITTNQWPR